MAALLRGSGVFRGSPRVKAPIRSSRKTSTCMTLPGLRASPAPDLTAFCRLEELGLVVAGQRLEPDRAVLAWAGEARHLLAQTCPTLVDETVGGYSFVTLTVAYRLSARRTRETSPR
jgi:hypothetical protein